MSASPVLPNEGIRCYAKASLSFRPFAIGCRSAFIGPICIRSASAIVRQQRPALKTGRAFARQMSNAQ
jgi:hypothetical protein